MDWGNPHHVPARPAHVLDRPWLRHGLWVLAAFFAVVAVSRVVLPQHVPFGIFVFGVVVGCINALVAVGLILVFRATRIVNFAHAEIGVLGALLFENLYRGSGLPWFLAALIGAAVSMATAAAAEVLIIRRFATASRLVVTVATIALAQIVVVLTVLVSSAFGSFPASGQMTTPFSGWELTISGVVFTGDALVLLLTVPLLVGGLGMYLHRTDFGIAVRASAESGERASLLGVPVARVSTVSWALAGAFAGIATIMRAPVVGLVTGGSLQGPGLLLRALAAAVIARMENLRVAVVAAILLGVAEQALFFGYAGSSITDALLVGIILVALITQRAGNLRTHDTDSTWKLVDLARPLADEVRRLPVVRVARWGLIGLVTAAALGYGLMASPSQANQASTVVIYAMVAVSLVVLTGWAGQISLGQFGLVAVGAAVAARASTDAGMDFFVAMVAGGLAGAAAAAVLGLVALRVRGFYFAVSSLAFAVAVQTYFLNDRFFTLLVPSGRPERPVLFGWLDTEHERTFYVFSLAVLALVLGAVSALRASRTARVLVAVRDNERALQSHGVSVARAKLTAFGISGFIAGLAGALLGVHQHAIAPSAFGANESIRAFSMAVIGGLGSVPGAVLGAMYVRGSSILFSANVALLVTGVGVLLVLMVLPRGLGGLLTDLRDRALRLVLGAPAEIHGDTAALSPVLAEVPPHEAATTGATIAERRPVPSPVDAVLACRDVTVSYGPIQVLFGVDLDVAPGEIVALLGTNGAGKSTLLRALSGTVAHGGTVAFEGDDLSGVAAPEIARRGVVQVPGGRGVFPGLTVAENLRVAAWLHRDEHEHITQAVEGALERFPVLADRWDEPAVNLSGGEQQMLTLAQALIARPKVLLIDELSLGLAPTVVADLLELVREINRWGVAIVLVEQSVNLALTVADRAVFLEKGEVRFEGPPAELLDRPDVMRSVFLAGAVERGPDALDERRAGRHLDGLPPVLEARGLAKRFGGIIAVDGVDLAVHPGETVGVLGSNGAGKTTLFDLISGFWTPDAGSIWLDGEDITDLPPHDRSLARLGRSFQDARLYPSLTVRETIQVALERHLDVADALSTVVGSPAARATEAATRERADELMELLGLGRFANKTVGELSTGSRRVVDLACCLGHQPKVLLLDEPSSGIAQREVEALPPLLAQVQRATGASLLVIDHDVALLRSVSDRLVAMELGRVIAEGDPAAVLADDGVIASYLGGDPTVVIRSGLVPDSTGGDR